MLYFIEGINKFEMHHRLLLYFLEYLPEYNFT
jgi:hypothetical protein